MASKMSEPSLCVYFYFECLFTYHIITYKSLFTTDQSSSRGSHVYYHSHTFCQLKSDNFLLLEFLAHGYNTK